MAGRSKEIIPEPEVVIAPKGRKRPWKLIIGGLAALLVWWWKTNTWPVVAVVGVRPVWRLEVDRTLFRQGGAAVIDNLVTVKLLENEMGKRGIYVSDAEIEKKVEEIREQLGEGRKLEEVLGVVSIADLKKQIRLQLAVERAVGEQATVSAQEIDNFVKENDQFLAATGTAQKRIEAEGVLKQKKLQEAIEKLVEEVRSQGKVWKLKV